MSALVWLHEDALRADHPVILQAGEDCEVVYIWDEDYFKTMDYGFKRLVFIYETLCELPVTIYKGKTAQVLTELIDEKQAEKLFIPATPNPALQKKIEAISDKVAIKLIEDVPFVSLSKAPGLGRFFRYWNKARKMAMQVSQL